MKKIIIILFTLSLSLLVTCADGLEDMLDNLEHKVPVCVRSDAPDGGNGRGWVNAYNNLQTAIDAAPAGSEIWVAGEFSYDTGSSVVVINKPLTLIGGFTGSESRKTDRASAGRTVISGTGSTVTGLFNITANDVTIDGFSFQNILGDVRGIDILGTATATISNCNFTDNNTTTSVTVNGRAVNVGGSASVAILHSKFENNSGAKNCMGGALYFATTGSIIIRDSQFNDNGKTRTTDEVVDNGGAIAFKNSAPAGSLTIDNSHFAGNVAEYDGGALYLNNVSEISISNESTFNKNYNIAAQYGGAIYSSSCNKITISDSVFISNGYGNSGAGTIRGGALGVDVTTSANIINCTFDKNKAIDSGGGIYMNGSSLSIRKSHITNCEAGLSGGGIHIRSGTCEISSSYIMNNSVQQGGGGIYSAGDDNTTLNLSTTEISDNSSTQFGAGICIEGSSPTTFTAQSTKFSGNTAGSNGGAICSNDTPLVNTSVINMCRFYNNSSLSGNGGAIYYKFTSPSPQLTINNSIFDWNNGINGAAVYANAALMLKNLTFYHNHTISSAKDGGGALYLSSLSIISNSAFWGNTRPDMSSSAIDMFFEGGAIFPIYNSCYNSSTSVIGPNSDKGGYIPSTGISPFISVDIQNSNYLKPSSILINKGKEVDDKTSLIYGSYDAAGNSRKVGTKVDIGAYEAQ